MHSHGSLAWVSFVAVLIAILAAYGLGLWFRIPFSSVIFTLSFLLLGIGMDDTFVIVAAFQDEEVVHLPPRERVAEAMSRAGSSIALTSMTDLCAFLAGSYCSIPVSRLVCKYVSLKHELYSTSTIAGCSFFLPVRCNWCNARFFFANNVFRVSHVHVSVP